MKKFWFDMDGTIANLYSVENWLEKLRAFDASPYEEATPLVNLSRLARMLHKVQKNGGEIGIISWLSKVSTEDYDKAVTEAKLNWLKKHMPSVEWNEIKIVSHGISKSEAVGGKLMPSDFLFDDEENNLVDWEEAGGWSFSNEEIFETLKDFA